MSSRKKYRQESQFQTADNYVQSVLERQNNKGRGKGYRVRSNISNLVSENDATPKSNLKNMAPNKLINEIDDEFPDTERTIFNIVKEEQKSITVDKEESQQND